MATKVVKTMLVDRKTVTSMCKAIAAIPLIRLVKDRDSAVASIGKTEVYRALRGPNGTWIVRYANGLFVCDGLPEETVRKIRDVMEKLGGINNVRSGTTVE